MKEANLGFYEDDWKLLSNCRDDERFTWRREWLSHHDLMGLNLICMRCPVWGQCKQWADDEQVTDVFAAGEWKDSDDGLLEGVN